MYHLFTKFLQLVLLAPVYLIVFLVGLALTIEYPGIAIPVLCSLGIAQYFKDSAVVIATIALYANVRALVFTQYQTITSFIALPEIRYIVRRSFEYPFMVPAHHVNTSADPASPLVRVGVFQWFLITIRFWLSDLGNSVYAALPPLNIFLVSIFSMLASIIVKFVVAGTVHIWMNHLAMQAIKGLDNEPSAGETLALMDDLLMLMHLMFGLLYFILAIVPIMKCGSIMNNATKMALESASAVAVQPLLLDDAGSSQSVTPMPTPDELPGTPNTGSLLEGDHECCECKSE